MSEHNYLLTPEESDRFAFWLERNADSNRGMIEQWEKINGPHIDAITKKLKTEETAYRIVARILRETERMEVR